MVAAGRKTRYVTFSVVNNVLLCAIVVINLYIIAAPFAPRLLFALQNRDGKAAQTLDKAIHDAASAHTPTSASQPNHITIPSMLLDRPIFEGVDTYAMLNKGIWRWPHSSTPDAGGNTVLIGHRFTYTNPRGVLYSLDKVAIGDTIGLWWNSKQYVYRVSTIKEVPSSQTSILEPTPTPVITIYTCTPLWNPVHRLVVIANLETGL